jgi:energy-converting hydrogenase A subunit M
MRKLTDYIEMAATEYLEEVGNSKLDVLWIAEFFQDGGVQDDYPRQDLVDFYALVQKALTIKFERAEKRARLQQEKSKRSTK